MTIPFLAIQLGTTYGGAAGKRKTASEKCVRSPDTTDRERRLP